MRGATLGIGIPAAAAAAVAERDAPQRTRSLIASLRSAACYPHPVGEVEVMQTHISYVVLAGEFAYKIKKPVRFAFLDFADLESRRHYCEEELRLNRRTAPGLYLDVVTIGGTPEAPVVGADGGAIEYAVRMRRFPQEDLLDHRARAGRLRPEDADALAAVTAEFHARAAPAAAQASFATPGLVLAQALDNFTAIRAVEHDAGTTHLLDEIHAWTLSEHAARGLLFEARRAGGFVRECHGDLHLANVVMLQGVPAPFDCIEFDARMSTIDVMSDVAFTVMDLYRLELPRLAARYLDAYLQRSGDYEGLGVLRFYAVYRAMVRAKIACLRACAADLDERERPAAVENMRCHLALARRLSLPLGTGLILMHGLSASGKSSVAAELLEAFGAIRLRSDVERKRLHGLAARDASGSPLGAGIYGAAQTTATYERLRHLAAGVLADGYPVIVDATFLERAQREPFRLVAERLGVPFAIVACTAPEAVLRERLGIRARTAGDASEADAAVLQRQLAQREPFGDDEPGYVIVLDTTRPDPAARAQRALLRRL